MKKIILSTVVLIAFSLSMILFQISCKKEALADFYYILPTATTTKLGGVKPDGTSIKVTADGTISTIPANTGATAQENKIIFIRLGTSDDDPNIWTSNYDGSNATKINIAKPAGLSISNEDIALSPDHKTMFFTMNNSVSPIKSIIFSCNLDGTNLKQVSAVSVISDKVRVAY